MSEDCHEPMCGGCKSLNMDSLGKRIDGSIIYRCNACEKLTYLFPSPPLCDCEADVDYHVEVKEFGSLDALNAYLKHLGSNFIDMIWNGDKYVVYYEVEEKGSFPTKADWLGVTELIE